MAVPLEIFDSEVWKIINGKCSGIEIVKIIEWIDSVYQKGVNVGAKATMDKFGIARKLDKPQSLDMYNGPVVIDDYTYIFLVCGRKSWHYDNDGTWEEIYFDRGDYTECAIWRKRTKNLTTKDQEDWVQCYSNVYREGYYGPRTEKELKQAIKKYERTLGKV